MIVDLLDAGRTVGITATRTATIGQLLREVVKVAGEQQLTCHALQNASEPTLRRPPSAVEPTTGRDRPAREAGEVNLVAGTPWLWSVRR